MKPFFYFILSVIVLALAAAGWPEPKFYPCIHYDENQIVPATESGLNNFFKALDKLCQQHDGKVSIVHIGDSHVQADYFSNTTRRLLQVSFGNAGRGFIFPHRIAKTNNAYSFGVLYSGNWSSNKSVNPNDNGVYGITGATVSTNDSNAQFFINPQKLGEMNYETSRMRVFYEDSENSFNFNISGYDSVQLEYDEIPDGKGTSDIYFNQPIDSFRFNFRKSWMLQNNFRLHGFSLENNYSGIIYHSVGLNGAYAKSYLRNQYFNRELSQLHPNLVIVSLGTNDGYLPASKFCINCFKDSYRSLLTNIKKAAPGADILITTPGDNFIRARYHNQNVEKITEALYDLAAEFDAAIWDFNKIMGGNYSMRAWKSYGLAQADLVHFTEEGYKVMGTLLYDAIMKSYEKRFNP